MKEKLNALRQKFEEKNEFKPGDIVRWKPEMQNKKYPLYGGCAVVLEKLGAPVVAEDKEGDSPYFMEPLDLVLGHVDSDGDFLIFHYDSRRFEHAE